ncbi:DUF2169 domain-containing protein [Halomonas sabkhae]|uniref:DUF2169 family type VI secretion system accessory protein n=1 Tax=Halomonas sabkhae TaxID=626223 RepID=UPI0025B3859B|nr:DUF2169 domain-containing protein [Halomonas sabkhae]MDN3526198.1 DUF2169 domain-containing protein [Halomonas sabkhae]
MTPVTNMTPFPEALFRKVGPGDKTFEVLAVRGTFQLMGDGETVMVADNQQPIRWQESRAGDPDNRVAQFITHDHDLVPGKPGTELQVRGTLVPPGGMARAAWRSRFRVGDIDYAMSVFGKRYFEWKMLGGWQLTDPEPTTGVPLDYRYAFGGHFAAPDMDTLTPEQATLCYPQNPVGCGWLPRRGDYRRVAREAARYWKPELESYIRLPAPQLEHPDWRVRSPFDRVPPAGAGPIAPWWTPRVECQGTHDKYWHEQRRPLRPLDFDERFYQSAPPALVSARYLRGDEWLTLTNAMANSCRVQVGEYVSYHHRARLPGIGLDAYLERPDGLPGKTSLALDTLEVDLDSGEVSLTWRALFLAQGAPRQIRLEQSALSSPRYSGAMS